MTPRIRTLSIALLTCILPFVACFGGSDTPVAPGQASLRLSPSQIDLGSNRAATLTLRNVGRGSARGVRISTGAVRQGPATAEGIEARIEPATVNVLEPGDSVDLELTLEVEDGTREGVYSTEVVVRLSGETEVRTPVTLAVTQIRDLRILGDFELDRQTTRQLWAFNAGSVALESVALVLSTYRPVEGGAPLAQQPTVVPEQLGDLAPGDSAAFEVSVELEGGGLVPGRYSAGITALSRTGVSGRADITFRIPQPATLEVTAPTAILQGDAFDFAAVARDSSGAVADRILVEWTLPPPERGRLDVDDGLGVIYEPGTFDLEARAGALVETVSIDVSPRTPPAGGVAVLGRADVCVDRRATGIARSGSHVYLAGFNVDDQVEESLLTIDVSDPASPVLVDSLELGASSVSDVAVSADGTLAALALEDAEGVPGRILMVDLADPAAPTVLGESSASVGTGVIDVEFMGDHVYATRSDGLSIFDVSDPTAPALAFAESPGDVSFRQVSLGDGLAFSMSSAAVVILDVGGGGAGGTPAAPVEVGRIMPGEDSNFSGGAPVYDASSARLMVPAITLETGVVVELRIYDIQDLSSPVLLGTLSDEVPSGLVPTPNTMALDGDKGVLYVPWSERGLRVVDVTGRPFGDLALGGRLLTEFQYQPAGGQCLPEIWSEAAVLGQGLVFLADRNSGLVVLEGF